MGRRYAALMNMSSQDPVPLRPAGSPTLRIRLPPKVAHDQKAFSRVVANLGELTGCTPCNSGYACFFELDLDYRVNEKLQFESTSFNASRRA